MTVKSRCYGLSSRVFSHNGRLRLCEYLFFSPLCFHHPLSLVGKDRIFFKRKIGYGIKHKFVRSTLGKQMKSTSILKLEKVLCLKSLLWSKLNRLVSISLPPGFTCWEVAIPSWSKKIDPKKKHTGLALNACEAQTCRLNSLTTLIHSTGIWAELGGWLRHPSHRTFHPC